jgi:hypothetical protein
MMSLIECALDVLPKAASELQRQFEKHQGDLLDNPDLEDSIKPLTERAERKVRMVHEEIEKLGR